MSYTQSVLKTWQHNQLFSALVELTYRCNLDCFFCYNDLGLKGTALKREDYDRLLEQLAELGCLHLTLSGGEPLAHPDFFEIGSRARELGFVIRIKSNGHALNEKMARRIQRTIDPFMIELSLHGSQAATHDRQTRVPGSFERLVENLRSMRRLGVRFKLNSTLTRWNEDEIAMMYQLADHLGVSLQFDPEVTPKDDGNRDPLRVSPSADAVARLYRIQGQRAARHDAEPAVAKQADAGPVVVSPGKHCGAGSSGVAIDPMGNVYPCVQWRVAIGNLHHQCLSEIWKGEPVGKIRSLTVAVRDKLHGMEDQGRFLNFCPGSARMSTGDPLGVSAATLERARVAKNASLLPVHPRPEG